MCDYKNRDLCDILLMVRTKDNGAFEELVARYTPMLNKVAAGFVNSTLLFDEAFSEACLALHSAAMSYDLDRVDVTFGLYARICAYRRLCDVAAKSAKAVQIVDTDVDTLYVDANIESRLVGRERMRAYLLSARKILSDYEYEVFLCYIKGENTQKISEKLGKDVKSVENAKSRMFKHLREHSELFSDI